jgi:hypothetical protein
MYFILGVLEYTCNTYSEYVYSILDMEFLSPYPIIWVCLKLLVEEGGYHLSV